MNRRAQRYIPLLILAAILLLAWLVRTQTPSNSARCGYTTMSVWYDEAVSLVLVNKPWDEMMTFIRTDDHPPLYYYLLRAWMSLNPHDIPWARMLSILLGVVVVGLVYFFIADLFDPRTAMIAALFAALSPYMVHYSHEIRMYTLLALFVIIAQWMTWKLREKWDWRCAAVWVIAAFGIAYTHYYGLLAVLGMFGCLATWRYRQTRKWGRTFAALAVLLLAGFLLYWHWLFWFFVQLQNNISGGVHAFEETVPLRQAAAYYMDPFLGRIPQLPFEQLYGRLIRISAPAKIYLFIVLVLALVGKAIYDLRRDRERLIYFGWNLLFPLLFTLFVFQMLLNGRLFGRLLIVYWTLLFALAAFAIAGFKKTWLRLFVALLIVGCFWSSTRLYSAVDERGVARFVWEGAVQPRSELPVYHTSAWGFFPLLVYDNMDPRHYLLIGEETTLLHRMLAGAERIVKPSDAAEKIQLPCLLVVTKTIDETNPQWRERDKQQIIQNFLEDYFMDGIQSRTLYDIGRRKWSRTLLIQPTAD